jgi:hypothetical protein
MPSPTSPLARLPEAVSKTSVLTEEHAMNHQVIIDTILEMTEDLLSFTKRDTLLGKGDPNPDLYAPSLGSIYARLESGQVPPSPIAVGSSPKKKVKIHKRTNKTPSQRSLPEYEDIYYALLALVQEMHWDLTTRINNGFNHIDDFICEGSVRIFQLVDYLYKGWKFLNDPSVAKAFDDAVREACYKITQKKFRDDFKEGKYLAKDYKSLLKALKKDYDDIPGLVWIGGGSPAMINAYLHQKWRPVYSAERMDKIRKEAWKKAEQVEKRMSAERKEREELLKAKLQEEVIQRQAQLAQEEMQMQAQQEQNQAEQTRTARANLVSNYMENLRSTASPHARRLVHGTGYDISPIPFGGLQTPTGYTNASNQLEFLGSTSIQGNFFIGSLPHNSHGASMDVDIQQGYHGGGSVQNSCFGPDIQHFGRSGLTENQGHTSPNGQYGFSSRVTQHACSSPIAQHEFTSPTAQHGVTDPDVQPCYIDLSDQFAQYETELPLANGVDPITQQSSFNGEHVPDDQAAHHFQPNSHDDGPFQTDISHFGVRQSVSWNAPEAENLSGPNALQYLRPEEKSPECQSNLETQPGFQDEGHTPDAFPDRRYGVYGIGHPRNASTYLVQQEFNMQGLVQENEQAQEGGDSSGHRDGDGDVDMLDGCS